MPNPEHQAGSLQFSIDVLSHEKTIAQAQKFIAKAISGDNGVSLLQARRFYQEQADTIVPSSVDRWAESNGWDVTKKRQQELRRTFAKDVATAKRFSKGVETKGTIFQLSDMIKEKAATIRSIDEELARRTR